MNEARTRAMRAARLLTTHWRRRPRRKVGARRQRDLARSARWGWTENIVGVTVGSKLTGGEPVGGQPGLTFHVRRKLAKRRLTADETIPLQLRLSSVAPGSFRTDVVQVSDVPRGHDHRPGTELGHYRNPPGTSGLIVTNDAGEICVLSCSHVLARGGLDVREGDPIEQPWLDDYQAVDVIARLTHDFTVLGASNTEDVALARLTVTADPRLAGTGAIVTAVSTRTAAEFEEGTPTELHGATSGVQAGTIGGPGVWKVDMPIVGVVEMQGLVSYRTVCGSGDSGGVVLEGDTATALGLHVAGLAEDRIGLLLPLGPIFESRRLSLVTPEGARHHVRTPATYVRPCPP